MGSFGKSWQNGTGRNRRIGTVADVCKSCRVSVTAQWPLVRPLADRAGCRTGKFEGRNLGRTSVLALNLAEWCLIAGEDQGLLLPACSVQTDDAANADADEQMSGQLKKSN